MNQGHCLTDVARVELRSRLTVGNAATSISRNGATGSCDVITAGNLSGNNWFNPVIQPKRGIMAPTNPRHQDLTHSRHTC